MINKNYIPSGWVKANLTDFCDIILGQSPPSSTYNENGVGLPFYQGKLEFGEIYPTPQKWCTEPHKIAEKGDVLISVRAPVGPTNICPEKSCIGRGLGAIRGLGRVDSLFLLYLMRANETELAGRGTGTTFDAITGNQLRDFEVQLPPLAEQHRIVAKIEELYTRLDAGVASLKKAKEQLKQYRQAVLKSAFEGKLTEEWRERNKQNIGDAISYLSKYNPEKNSSETIGLYKIPMQWSWTRIQNVAKVSGGITKNSKRERLPNKLPYLRVANVYAGKLDLSEVKTIGVMGNEVPHYLLQKGDLLIIEGNGSPSQIGRVAIWDGSISPCIHQNHVIKVRFYDAEVAAFVQYWLSSSDGRKDIVTASSSTSGLYTLSISKVESLRIPLAPLSEQKKIVEEIESHLSIFDSIEKSIDANLSRTETLRQSILAQAFSGKLVPQDPNDEPAEKLLERIRAERAQKEGGKERAPGRKRGRQTAIT